MLELGCSELVVIEMVDAIMGLGVPEIEDTDIVKDVAGPGYLVTSLEVRESENAEFVTIESVLSVDV